MQLMALGTLVGCGKNEQPAGLSREDVKKESKEADDATRAYNLGHMQAFQEQTEARLAEYGNEIDKLQAKVEKLEGNAKAKAEQQLATLHQKQDAVYEKLKDLGSSSEDAWEQIKSGIESALEDLGKTNKKAAADFSKS
jgi:uncharacterized coiled-coil protein SlyX